jgi:riboflavin kinase/FMN adenylyltransferase
MKILSGDLESHFQRPVFLTIGNFDGIHLGHQALITELIRAARAADGVAGLLTFDPHPLAVLRPDIVVPRLTSNAEQTRILEALGLDFVLALPFTRETAATPAEGFMRDLTRRVPLRELWIGPDFALGRGRQGNKDQLEAIGLELEYRVRVIEPFDLNGEPVRSTRVRSLLLESGAVADAQRLLGRPYALWGEVRSGAQRGRRLGFPTANLAIPTDRLIPYDGVYACWAWRGDQGRPAVVNIGVRPSFDNGSRSIEAYLMDFAEELYGEQLGLSFVARIRAERHFPDVDALRAQIAADVSAARSLLASPPTHGGAASWQEVSHTADWAVLVRAEGERGLLANAACAMMAMQGAEMAMPAERAHDISVTAGSFPELLVGWLNRLLLEQELMGEVYNRYELFEVSDRGARAHVYGYAGTLPRPAVKAVTFHELSVNRVQDGLEAAITFDV